MDNRSEQLVAKYNAGILTDAEQHELERLIEDGKIPLESLAGLHTLEEQMMRMETPAPSLSLDDRFHNMLSDEKKKSSKFSWKAWFALPELMPRLAFASVTLIIGLAAGYFLRPAPVGKAGDMAALTEEVSALKEMMMLSLLEKESATDRLKAVSLSQEMGQASRTVTHALLETLNNDGNVNVRLAALDALEPYTNDSHIREELIRSISTQDSPLVQVALAEIMVNIQAKSSVKELEKILKREGTPKDVKNKIKESIEVLI